MKKIGNFIVRTVDYVFFGLMILILTAAILVFSETITSGAMKYVIAMFTALFACFFVVFGNTLILGLKRFIGKISNIPVKRMCIIIFASVLITKVFFVFLFDNDISRHPDMATYKSFAYQLANRGEITEYVYSAYKWKYEVIYGLFLSPAVKLFGDDSKVLLTYLSFVFAVACVLIFDIIRDYIGKDKAFTAIILFNLLPAGLFETQILVHETALLFFYILSFWLLTKAANSKYNTVIRALALIASAVLIAFGNKINKGGTVVIISYAIYIFVNFCKDKFSFASFTKAAFAIVCYILCFYIISNLCVAFVKNVVKLDEHDKERISQIQRNAVPYGWSIYLGANLETPGLWNGEDSNVYSQYQNMENREEAKQYQLNLINERLEPFIQNPLIIPSHLFKKLKTLWGAQLLPFDYGLGNDVNEFVLNGMHGIIYKTIWLVSNLSYILLCAILVFSHKRHNTERVMGFYSPVTQFKMMIVGLTGALILFEVTPKYVSYLQMILFVIMAFGLSDFTDNSKRIKNKLIGNLK
ncbi:MAG: glycosyltransferase family 39 protein [Clostridiales bacterium]|nr:glycosyltransferase family 39 protein [Clostridiales bacterium]